MPRQFPKNSAKYKAFLVSKQNKTKYVGDITLSSKVVGDGNRQLLFGKAETVAMNQESMIKWCLNRVGSGGFMNRHLRR